jgi:acyl-CoA thioester hydrolase
MFHHLNNPIYGVLIDSIINAYLMERCDYSTSTSERIGLVANTYCDYFGSAQYPGVLDVGLRVVKLGKSSVMYEVGIFQGGEEKIKAVGGFVQIWVKRADNRPAEDGIEKHVREELMKLVNSDDSEVVKPKL